jgi:hypothetical protein
MLILGLLGSLAPKRVRRLYAFGALSLLLLITAAGCGARTITSLTPPGSYLVAVTASSMQAGKQIAHVTYIQINVTARSAARRSE